MSPAPDAPIGEAVARHVRAMRMLAVVFLLTLPAAGAGAFFLPRARVPGISPPLVLLATAAVALWYAFTVNRAAARRLRRVRERFGEHGDVSQLLREHRNAYLLVLVRLEVIVVCGLINAEAGAGPRTTVWFVVLAAILMALAWPTERKTRLLLERVGASVR